MALSGYSKNARSKPCKHKWLSLALPARKAGPKRIGKCVPLCVSEALLLAPLARGGARHGPAARWLLARVWRRR